MSTVRRGRARAVLAAAGATILGCVLTGALVVVATATPVSAAQTTYFVSPQGNDSGNGTKQRPWRTLQKAASAAPTGALISVSSGVYAPFVVSRAGQTITAATGQNVVVQGRAGVQDVIRVSARDVKLLNMTVTGCVPNPAPAGGFEHNGSSGIRINDGATAVTVQGMTVRDSHGTNSHGLPFGCYGVLVHNANGSRLVGNDISGNGAGIYFNGGGLGAVVNGNRVHDNDVIIRNTPGGNDDFGGAGVSFTHITAAPGPTATNNVLSGNAGPSSDYLADGGGFEIYNASHLRIENNTLANNENVLETGTSPGGRCADNRFVGNTASGRPPLPKLTKSVGTILRCAENMLIDSNTFNELDWWVFTIETGDPFSGALSGLTITNNSIRQWQKVYHLGVDPVANRITVDSNRINFTGPNFASYAEGADSPTLADWQMRTGLDLHSVEF